MSTILVVDDHLLNRQFLIALLGFDGHTVLTAADGLEALGAVRAERPALVISDILMPNLNGYEFVTRMRADPAVADIPVIFYTSTYSTREARAMARSCSVRWVLQKPAAPECILEAVHEALALPPPAAVPAAAPAPSATANGLVNIDQQFNAHMRELESSRQLIARIAEAGGQSTPDGANLSNTTEQLSRSLTELQSVGLRLTALIDMGIELSGQRDRGRLLESASRVARHISVAHYAVVCIVADDGVALRHLVVRGLESEVQQRLATLPAPRGIFADVLNNKSPRRLKGLDGDPRAVGLAASHPPVHSLLCLPVATAGRKFGWIYLVDKLGAEEFSEIDELAAGTVASQLAVAYENLELYESVQDNVAQLEDDLRERMRITDSLHESETRFRELAENIREVFFLLEPVNRRILYISPAYEEIWGRSCASLYRQPDSWMKAIHPDDLAELAARDAARGAEDGFDYFYRIVRPDGTLRSIHARGFPIRDGSGKVYRLAGLAADISEAANLQLALREREAGLQLSQQVARMAHVITGPDGAFESWSLSLPGLIGIDDASMPRTTRHWLDFIVAGDRSRFRDTCIAAGKSGRRSEATYRLLRGDGNTIYLQQHLVPIEENSSLHGGGRWFNTIQDVTEQKEQEKRIMHLSGLYAVLSGINSAIVRIRDRNELLQEACRVAVSQGAFSMAWAGVIAPDTLEGKVVGWHGGEPGYVEQIRFSARSDGPGSNQPACLAVRELRHVICNDTGATPALELRRDELLARGHRSLAALPLIVDARAVAVIVLFADEVDFFKHEGKLKLLDELAGDLSFGLQFIDREERLDYLAFYDALTGLPNRTLFVDRLAQSLLATTNDEVSAVVAINIDHLSHLNDTLGRHAGDTLLTLLANRLKETLHEPTSLARISGATFTMAFKGLKHSADAALQLEQQVLSTLTSPFLLARQEVRISVRCGIALFPGDAADAESLLKHAEVALKKAKSSNEPFLFYAPRMHAAIAARMALESDLRHALETRQFEMFYQPRVDLHSGRIIGAEALIRWHHPQRGLVGPVEFIPLAEETGLIVPLSDWILEAVCTQQALWKIRQVALVPVAVNLSAVQFKHAALVDKIRASFLRHELAHEYIEFELTESVVMDDAEAASRSLAELKTLGVQLSLDDFGTGYSSLAYLKRFPFDFVKIDRSFIVDVTKSAEDAVIASAVIAMAHSLGLRVVAEGVENEGQVQFLRRHRCDELQGYYFSRPVPAADFEAMLTNHKRLKLTREPTLHEDSLLIVDDEPNNLSALRRLLRNEGYHVLTASSGEEGLELLAINPVQVILCDQRMPGMPGSHFLGLVKDLYPDTIRIILSGYTDLAAVTDSVNQGAVYKYPTKPWNDAELREHIRAAFRRYRPIY